MLQPFRIEVDGYLLLLLPGDGKRAYALYRAEAVLEAIHIFSQFAISLVFALHSDEQGGGVAEIAHCLHSQHSGGKRHLDLVHPDLEFIPEGGGVVDVVVKFHKDNDHAGRHP